MTSAIFSLSLSTMPRVSNLVAVILLVAMASGSGRELTSEDTFLAIDSSAFETMTSMSLSLREATKHPANPVLRNRPEGPDAWRAGFPWVLLDGGRYRMWYLARDAAGKFFTCYAESTDGCEWTRPELGLVEHRGSKANNICYRGHTLFPTVFRDDRATDPSRRYIATIYEQITDKYFDEAQRKRYGKSQPSIKCLAYSPDGLRWTEDLQNLFPIHAKVEGGTLFRIGDEWFMAHQQNAGEYPQVHPHSRFVSVSSSMDLRRWSRGEKPAFFFDPKFNGMLQTHVTPGYQNYGNVIVAAQGLFYDNEELLDHETDLTLILSNDGRAWRQPKPGQNLSYVLRRGDRGSWDHSFVVQGNLVNQGRRTLLFYNGSQWGNVDADGIQIGVAELPLDGYGTLSPRIGWEFGREGPFEGELLSKPVRITRPGLRLFLNLIAGADPRDQVKAEIADADGRALEGFRLDDCDAVNTTSVGLPMSWRGRTDLDALAGNTVRVKIHITAHNPQRTGKARALAPQLHAFYFDRAKLRLGQEHRIFAAGTERLHLSDPLHPSLEGVEITSSQPVSVTLSALNRTAVTLTFAGHGGVLLAGDAIFRVSRKHHEIVSTDGRWHIPLTADKEVIELELTKIAAGR